MNLATGLGKGVQNAEEKKSRFNLDQKKKQDAYVSQGNFYGTELANEEVETAKVVVWREEEIPLFLRGTREKEWNCRVNYEILKMPAFQTTLFAIHLLQ